MYDDDAVTDLDALRVWADRWFHLSPVANQVRRLFDEWDAAGREAEQLAAELGVLQADSEV